MAFAQELKDFVSSFQAGYDMVKSPEEKEQEAARTRYLDTQADTAEYDLGYKRDTEGARKQALDLGNESTRASIANTRSTMDKRRFDMEQARKNAPLQRRAAESELDNTQSLIEKRKFDMEQARENAPLQRRAVESELDNTQSVIESREVETETKRMELEEAKDKRERLKKIMKRKGGAFKSAPTRNKPGAVDPGPTSSLSGGKGGALVGASMGDTLKQSTKNAVKAGMLHNVNSFGLGGPQGVNAGGNEQAQLAYLVGENAESPDTMDAARKVVKEVADREMSPAEENAVFLSAMYEYHLSEGDPKKAEEVAGAILQSYRMKSAQWMAVAKAAAEEGDIDTTTMAAAKAYAYVPDGNEVSFEKRDDGKIMLKEKDLESGEVTSTRLMSPREMFSMAMGVGPDSFDKLLMSAAGEEVASPEPIKPSDERINREDFGAAFDEMLGVTMEDGAELPPEVTTIRGAGESVYGANLEVGNRVSPSEVARNVWDMVQVDPILAQDVEAEDQPMFGVKKADGGYMVHFPDSASMFVPEGQFNQLWALRTSRVQAAKEEAAGKKANSDNANARNERFMDSMGRAAGAMPELPPYEPSAQDKRRAQEAIPITNSGPSNESIIQQDPQLRQMIQRRDAMTAQGADQMAIMQLEQQIAARLDRLQNGTAVGR